MDDLKKELSQLRKKHFLGNLPSMFCGLLMGLAIIALEDPFSPDSWLAIFNHEKASASNFLALSIFLPRGYE